MDAICDVCGYDCEVKADSGNWTEHGVSIDIQESAVEHDRIMGMFGRANFIVCWCCWIKAFGIKERRNG